MNGTGCLADECRGFVGQCRILGELLESFGCEDTELVRSLIRGDWEFDLAECADEATEWLNSNAVADGHYLGWSNGNLMIGTDEWWNDSE